MTIPAPRRPPRPPVGGASPQQLDAWRNRVAESMLQIQALEATIARGRREATAALPPRRGEAHNVREAGGKYAFDKSETGRVTFDRLADAHRDAQTFALAVLALER